MGFSFDISIPAATVFFQGLISFFSPCVLPLLPLYIGYLSGGTGSRGEDGRIYYKRSKVMMHTLFFVIGVSFAFFLLGLGVSAVGTFFKSNQMMFARIGGVLVMMFGIYQLGILGPSSFLGKERRLPFKLDVLAMSPVTALLMGFTFSFAWTPCVGPALASVLLMAASAGTKTAGFALIAVYTIGFVLPFLAVGLFTTSLLEFFKKHVSLVKYTVKAGALLMIFMGFLMFTGKMNDVTGYLSRVSPPPGTEQGAVPGDVRKSGEKEEKEKILEESEPVSEADSKEQTSGEQTSEERAGENTTSGNTETKPGETSSQEDSTEAEILPAVDFEMKDQYGNTHKLEDYKGKTIFLNFWATWCPPCRAEMPDIQKIYESYDTEGDDALIVLGVAAPLMGREKSEAEIKEFLDENGYTYPVLMDTEHELFTAYGIYSFPTTFMIDRDGNVFGYASGQLNQEIMENIIRQTMEGKKD